ncbi:MAG: rRNA maturation RNase YbeY [Chloroflexi bacterium]|nr:rRNA maturation RNase YbeY [Chloroflexota bacterium]
MPNAKHIIHIQIDEAFSGDVAAKLLRDAARAALKHEGAASGSLSLAVSDDEALRNLNSQFLGHDYPTDVLSFPSDSDDPDDQGRYFGDVIISYPRAYAQAETGGHPVEAELQLLTVHGVLHLLGHDHADEKQKTVMWQAQAEILAGLGCEITEPYPEATRQEPEE